MPIIPQPPDTLGDCRLIALLDSTSSKKDGLAAKTERFVSLATPIVDQIVAGPFQRYTLHNRDHATKLIHMVEHITPKATVAHLSALELVFLIYSAFIHDMGMSLTAAERDDIITSDSYQDHLNQWPELSELLKVARSRVHQAPDADKPAIETLIYQLHEAALSEYLRPLHATTSRYEQILARFKNSTGSSDLFEVNGVSFESPLIEVCVSHNLGASALSESVDAYEDRFPRNLVIGGQRVNTQFCAAMLRLADIMDFDRERTPRILFESLGIPTNALPGAEVSLAEWTKHMAVHTIDMRDDEIVVSAECRHPAIEKAVREFCMKIEREIRDTSAVLRRNPGDVVDAYGMELPLTVRPWIHSVGYTFSDVSLRLNQSAIMALLMGERLYSRPGVPLRECALNSLDACEVRRRINPDPSYVPRIDIRSEADDTGRVWVSVDDNGIGMDEHVIENYLLRLGSSYYGSSEFRRHLSNQSRRSDFAPISRFGIGMVSAFLIGDVVEMETKSAFSPRGDNQARFVRIEKLGGIAFIAPSERVLPGTTARIRLRQDVAENFSVFATRTANYLGALLLRPWFLIRVDFGPSARFYRPTPHGAFCKLSDGALQVLNERRLSIVTIDLGRWSSNLTGFVYILLKQTPDGKLESGPAFSRPGGVAPNVLQSGATSS